MHKLLIIILTLLLSFSAYTKLIVISDIDDTIKKANTVGPAHRTVYHFLRKIPFFEMRDIFNELKTEAIDNGDGATFYYVSAAYRLTFNAPKWLKKHNFPRGASTLRDISSGQTFNYKYATIKKIIEKEGIAGNSFVFFGDNSSQDHNVYKKLVESLNLKASIFIRDVRTNATYFEADLPVVRLKGINYFFSEMELIKHPYFSFLSKNTNRKVFAKYKSKKLVPEFTFETIESRMKKVNRCFIDEDSCESRSKRKAKELWNLYHNRYL